jgi:predicted membrane protein
MATKKSYCPQGLGTGVCGKPLQQPVSEGLHQEAFNFGYISPYIPAHCSIITDTSDAYTIVPSLRQNGVIARYKQMTERTDLPAQISGRSTE